MSVLFETIDGPYPRATLLLRLPPPSIALVPEVRCAVVGNVDSGKSTTLGVLTRGMVHNGCSIYLFILLQVLWMMEEAELV